MPGSTKTSVEQPSRMNSYRALHDILSEGVRIKELREAALQLMEARVERERQEARQPAKRGVPFRLTRTLNRSVTDEPLFDEPWIDQTTEGPADLIRYFAIAAITEHKPELGQFDEDSYATIMDVAEFAVDVAVRLAGVSENWADEYRALTSYLRK